MTADPTQLKVVKNIGRSGILFSLARIPYTDRLFVGASDAKVYDIDISAEKIDPQEMVGHESYVTGVALAGKVLVSGAYDGRLIWWNTETRKQIRTVEAHHKWIRQVIASPDEKTIASVADDMVCRLWEAETGKLIRELKGHQPITPHHFPSMLYTCAFSADGKYLATADRVGHVVVWEVSTGKELVSVETPLMYTWDPKQRIHSIGGVRSVAFSPDTNLLAIGGIGQIGNIDHLDSLARIEVFDWRKKERTHEFPGDTYKGLVEHLAFHHDGDWLLAAGGDHNGFIKFIDLQTSKMIKQDKAPMHIHDLALNETSEMIYAAGHGKIVVWELKKEETAKGESVSEAKSEKSDSKP